ncbi:MAG: 3-oxoadipate enol-lactonase [Solirubrobacterales bacterium]|nr:3-oxoadipate enol-lactonase [Solirubrobacterales bacterium]MBV9716940.1 3-oxoadipate enol-lactonase [Solirubrobacterales bacterium]
MSVALHHELSGPADAPVLVLSGSLGTDLSMWDPQAQALSARFRLLRYDQRGHGRSPVPRGPYSIAELGQDLLALLDRLEIDRALICGLSIGGMTGMWVAAHAPERVQRLVLLCTSALLGPAEMWRERAETVRTSGVEAIADAGLERWFTEGFRRRSPEIVARLRAALVATPPEGYASCCEAIAAMDLRGDLASIATPTLVVSGADDPATPPEHGRRIADAVAGARFEVIGPAAHLASVEQPERVTELILGFLNEEAV